MPEVVTIIGHHRFAKTILAIKRVRVHAGWTLHPAKKAIDRARANERVDVPVPTEAARNALMSDLSELGRSTESRSISKEARTPDAPDWWLRVKGLSRVVEHLPTREGQGRIRLALRDCSIEPGDTVGWVMQENLVLSIGIDPDSLTRGEPMALIESEDMEDPELAADSIRQLYPLGMDLEVFAPEPLLWPVEWRLAREQLWSAVSHLPTELKSNPEGGSLEQ